MKSGTYKSRYLRLGHDLKKLKTLIDLASQQPDGQHKIIQTFETCSNAFLELLEDILYDGKQYLKSPVDYELFLGSLDIISAIMMTNSDMLIEPDYTLENYNKKLTILITEQYLSLMVEIYDKLEKFLKD